MELLNITYSSIMKRIKIKSIDMKMSISSDTFNIQYNVFVYINNIQVFNPLFNSLFVKQLFKYLFIL